MTGEWDTVARRSGACSKCQKVLQEQEYYHATLKTASEGFERRDFCQACWTDEDRNEAFSFWQARIPKKEEKKRLFVDNEVLLDFFRRLTETEEEGRKGFCFVLALILMRKRLLKYVSTEQKPDGEEIWIMKMAGEEKDYRVPNPHLDDEAIEKIRAELSSVLAGD